MLPRLTRLVRKQNAMPITSTRPMATFGAWFRSPILATLTGSSRSKACANRTRVVTVTNARLTAISANGTAVANRILVIGSPDSSRP
jgi:hypothetical protein